MKCLCGKKLDRTDLLQGSCQSCGDPIPADDAAKLRGELGMAEAAPPEVEAPVIENTPKEIPDSVDCTGCGTPLMGDELNQWWTGSCAYCGEENPNQGEPPSKESTSAETPSSDGNEKQPETSWPSGAHYTPPAIPVELIVNIGPMCGTSISVPEGIVGRDILSAALTDPWYHNHLARVSAEHFEITMGANEVTDLGSSNGTFIDGKRITGTQATRLPMGTDLNIGRNLQFVRGQNRAFDLKMPEKAPISVTHLESGVRIVDLVGEIHLGRHRNTSESEDSSPQEESWARMAKIQMTAMDDMDPKTLNYISRKHLTLTVVGHQGGGRSIQIDVPEGKARPEGEIPEEASTGDSFSFTLCGNTFEVELLEF